MKVVIQRVTRASVTIEQQLFSSISKGMLVLVGIQADDTDEDIGFFCIDNIPAALLPSITAFSKAGDNQLKRVALCMEIGRASCRERV